MSRPLIALKMKGVRLREPRWQLIAQYTITSPDTSIFSNTAMRTSNVALFNHSDHHSLVTSNFEVLAAPGPIILKSYMAEGLFRTSICQQFST